MNAWKAVGVVLFLLGMIVGPFLLFPVVFWLDWVGGPALNRAAFLVNLMVWLGIAAFAWQRGSWREVAGPVALFFLSHWWSAGNFLLSRLTLNGGRLDAAGQHQLLAIALAPSVCLALLFRLLPFGRLRVSLPISFLLGLAATGALFALAR
ncbi:MAG: hypothetical protein QM758_08400 [Armatimonas sp.]